MSRRPIAWMDYASRVLSCALLFATGFALVSQSPFVLRMRDDIPLSIYGLDGPQSIALLVAAFLSMLPLLAGPAFLGAFLACGWLMSGMGAYWWTLIPWDAWITDSGFPGQTPPGFWDFVLVAGPALVATLHVVLARVSRLRRDAKERGVEPDEAARAAGAAFLTGAAVLVVSGALAAALWAALASGALLAAPAALEGVPALVLAAVVVVAAWALGTKRVRVGRVKVPAMPEAPKATRKARARRAT